MSAPMLVFFLTFIFALLVHIKYQSPLWRAKRRLDKELGQKGFKALIYDRVGMLKMIRNPDAIFSDADTAEIRVLKQAVVDRTVVAQKGLSFIVKIMLLGLVLSILTAWLGFFLEKRP